MLKRGPKFISSKSVFFKRKKLLVTQADGLIGPILGFAFPLISGLLGEK